MDSIKPVILTPENENTYTATLADCVILTKDKKLLMQKRPDNWHTSPGVLN